MFRSAAAKLSSSNVTRLGHVRRAATFSSVALQAPAATHRASSTVLVVATAASVAITTNVAHNHCQVPCGIFDDPSIVKKVKQDCETIRKAMAQSNKLWNDTTRGIQSVNQVVRWIKTKEEHCDSIIQTMSDYCLCQRVKRDNFKTEEEYLQALKIHHTVMQAAMKAKQTMESKACDELERAVEELSKMYT